MKRTNFILNGFLALAIVLVFAQCSDNNNAATSSTAPAVGVAGSSNMKIAYVEIDSLLTKYNFWNDLNEVMIQKEENIRTKQIIEGIVKARIEADKLDLEYLQRFKKILSPKKIYKLQRAEIKFHRDILKIMHQSQKK